MDNIAFALDFSDLADNQGETVSATTDGSKIFIAEKTATIIEDSPDNNNQSADITKGAVENNKTSLGVNPADSESRKPALLSKAKEKILPIVENISIITNDTVNKFLPEKIKYYTESTWNKILAILLMVFLLFFLIIKRKRK